MKIGPTFRSELLVKAREIGLELAVPGVSWNNETGMDPLPVWLTSVQSSAIYEVVAAHDATKLDLNTQLRDRAAAYPPIGDQLDDLFRHGAFSPEMAAQLQAVKTAHPKGR